MKINNKITFQGERVSMSSCGNTEWFEATITSQIKLSQSAVESIMNIHEMGGQSFKCELIEGDVFTFKCKSTRYSD